MFRNYLKIALRSLWRNKTYSAINLTGLATGMAVAMLIGLWMHDELTFDQSFANYDRLGQLYQHQQFNGHVGSHPVMPVPLAAKLRSQYSDFADVAMTTAGVNGHVVAVGDTKLIRNLMYVEPQFTRMFSIQMLKGTQNGLTDVNSIMLAESLAKALFKDNDPIGKLVKINNEANLIVTGVFADFSPKTAFADVAMLAPWAHFASANAEFIKTAGWSNNSFQCFVQLAPSANGEQVSAKIKNVLFDNIDAGGKVAKPVLFIHPMPRWHLYGEFKEGVNVGGRIQFVWLFGIVGAFVLLLACINFMNLSTARSSTRAKEVGIRKAVGSVRSQLINQFLSESMLTVAVAFVLAVGLVVLALPWFNQLANKTLTLPLASPVFWLLSLAFMGVTGLLAGSYPALYLSSFNPISTLKGHSSLLRSRMGRFAAMPRKVLVVVQFTVSVALIIGTTVVYQQIQHARNRPIGYDRNRLVQVNMNTPELRNKYNPLRAELLATGVVENMSQSSGPLTDTWSNNVGFNWPGKQAGADPLFATIGCSHDFGKTAGFQLVAGRDFSRAFPTDSSAILINESAAKIMGRDVIGKTVTWSQSKTTYHVVGIVNDMVMQSPYDPIMPTLFMMRYDWASVLTVKIKPTVSAADALPRIAAVFRQYDPGSPFDYTFVDQEFARKFADEERVGRLATVFAVLAIFISCLGLFGMASFVAEQRTKEIGIRKTLGASVMSLWQLLTKDFVLLVLLASVLSAPIAWYYLNNWLNGYDYRITISIWVFVASALGALLIALLTVSFQSIKAALMNPVKSLRSE